jgi:hypothetical protein
MFMADLMSCVVTPAAFRKAALVIFPRSDNTLTIVFSTLMAPSMPVVESQLRRNPSRDGLAVDNTPQRRMNRPSA